MGSTQRTATKTSIIRTLEVFAERMDPDNDILFIFLTSHGSKDFEFSLNQTGLSIADLPASGLAAMLESLPVRWKVIVISACYSGGFIPKLENETTMIITAAADDRRSFGCSDHADFTYFGEAFFKHAVPETDSFADAFIKAVERVAEMELGQSYQQSQPQIRQPDAILEKLRRWRSQLNVTMAASTTPQ